jgi:hypothetical protein
MGQHHAPAALCSWERPGTHCTGGWVDPRAGLDRFGQVQKISLFLRRLMHYLWIFAELLVNQMCIHVSVVILYLLKRCKEMQSLMIMRWHMAMHGRGNEGKTMEGVSGKCHMTMEHSLSSMVQTLVADAHTLAANSSLNCHPPPSYVDLSISQKDCNLAPAQCHLILTAVSMCYITLCVG